MSTIATTRDAQALAILRDNDRGNFSVPTKGLYPFQWNWDSAFAALGYRHIDEARAWRELTSLAAAQWPDGMIPHIIFHEADDGYFPGPEVWATGRTPPTSGISQPPVLAIAIQALAAHGLPDKAILDNLLDAAGRWHQWFLDARLDAETGAVGIIHPWESGRDNMPDWDDALSAISIEGVKPFKRRDLGHVDAAMRPTDAQYKRYIALVEFGISVSWDQRLLNARSPFFVADPGMTGVLIFAERALIAVAQDVGRDDLVAAAHIRLRSLEKGFNALFDDDLGGPTTRNVRSGARGTALSSAAFLGLAPNMVTPERHERLLAAFDRFSARVKFMVPSYDPDATAFDEKRYWRGPAWLVVNWLVAMGLQAAGLDNRAERIRADCQALVEQDGFFEYYSALSGAGLGGDQFTWTAATWLEFVRGTDGKH